MEQAKSMQCFLVAVIICCSCLQGKLMAENPEVEEFSAIKDLGLVAKRDGKKLLLQFDGFRESELIIPRLAAPVIAIHWSDKKQDNIQIKPEQREWIIQWNRRAIQGQTMILEFSEKPLLLSEIKSIGRQSDGSFWLPAHLAETQGQKIRYEPQTFKNTIGYWVGAEDKATWQFALDRPGRFNVAVLQGCGKGQGGSSAQITVMNGEPKPAAELRFCVLETGHFQNFRWRHLGVIELRSDGLHALTVEPIEIAATALMDIRAVHLIRLPESR